VNAHHLAKGLVESLQFAAEDVAAASRLIRKERLAPYIGLVGYRNLGDELLFQAHQQLFSPHKLEPYRQDTILVERLASFVSRPFCTHAILGGGTLIYSGDAWLSKTEHLLSQGASMFCLGTGVESDEFVDKRHESLKKRWQKALAKFAFVGVRGPKSKEALEKDGFRNVKVMGDAALSLTPETVSTPISREIIGINFGHVPGNPMWGDPAKYKKEMAAIIKQLIHMGHKVYLLPVWNRDIPSNQELMRDVDHSDCSLVEAHETTAEYFNAVRQCDLFIGQKLHATVMAIMNRVPSMMIEYRPKCMDFMESIGLSAYVIKTSDLNLKSFMYKFDELQRRHAGLKSQIEDRILGFKRLQYQQAVKLRELMAH
jgi:hypothetical protein